MCAISCLVFLSGITGKRLEFGIKSLNWEIAAC